ncbi:KH domain-containing protein [bacterium]|nr:KH domain-containing protein [bacterium]
MQAKEIKTIEELLCEFFDKMTLDVEIEMGQIEGKRLPVNLRTKDPQLLIGKDGRVLFSIQAVLGRILKKKVNGEFFIDLDINQYKKNKISALQNLAQRTADRVSLTKKEETLYSMPAYERRIIHLTLAERQDIATESVGNEPERRVRIMPVQKNSGKFLN